MLGNMMPGRILSVVAETESGAAETSAFLLTTSFLYVFQAHLAHRTSLSFHIHLLFH